VYGGNSYSAFEATLTVTLQEIYVNNILASSPGFALSNATIEVGQTIDLKDLVTLPAGATYLDSSNALQPITKEHLTWKINGTTLPGSSFTGVSTGKVPITVTLPANKNQVYPNPGVEVTKTATLTVNPPPHPSTFTLRIIKMNNTSDKIKGAYAVPVTAAYGENILKTGRTKINWALGGTNTTGVTVDDAFQSKYLPGFPGWKSYVFSFYNPYYVNDYTDLELPWPTDGNTGYNLFLLEGDNRVRGYVNPGALDPPQKNNFLFYIDAQYVYDHYRLAMTMRSDYKDGHLQADPNKTSEYKMVIPIGYDSYYNIASIMKAAGVGQRPTSDTTDY
jgi:hypothetical protein